jgi:hypothetical protein
MKIFTDEEWSYLCSKINWSASFLDARAVRIMNKPNDNAKDVDDEAKKGEIVELINAEEGEGFQEYCDEDGKRIPAGTPIGVEIDGQLKLLNGIYFDSEARR